MDNISNICRNFSIDSNYTKVPNSIFLNNDISLAARGLYCWLIFESGRPFTFSPTYSNSLFTECPDTIKKLLKELMSQNYILFDQKSPQARTHGKFDYTQYTIIEPLEKLTP